ncbi:hypothetical protein M9435_006757 [Picochlorum sp. BPE23]|nr:hypothetical protein M9435_006757 [Picochlorum sp. BPE23]
MDTGVNPTLADLRRHVDVNVRANAEKAIRLVYELSHEYPCFQDAENKTPQQCIRLIDEVMGPQQESPDWPMGTPALRKLYDAKVALETLQRGMP